jgi:hypothetical protein
MTRRKRTEAEAVAALKGPRPGEPSIAGLEPSSKASISWRVATLDSSPKQLRDAESDRW